MSCEVYWRGAYECYQLSLTTSDKKEKQAHLLKGQSLAEQAIAVDENNFDALRWAAVTTGHLTNFYSGKEKAEIGNKFKGYLDRALAINNKEFSLLHMRGRYTYTVASLSWFEKKAAALIFSSPPTGTYEESLEFLLAAYKERPVWIENLLYIARCYIELKKKDEAKKYLNEALTITPADENERSLLEEVRKLLSNC